MRLINDLRYGSLSNPNQSLNLELMRVGNHREHLLRHFHFFGQGFNHISFLELISSYNEGERFHLDHSITLKDCMSYPLYDVLKIMWLGIHKSKSKHNHPSTRCLWCLKSKDHIHNYNINQHD